MEEMNMQVCGLLRVVAQSSPLSCALKDPNSTQSQLQDITIEEEGAAETAPPRLPGEREAVLRCNDAYESHIDFRWEAHVTRQVALGN